MKKIITLLMGIVMAGSLAAQSIPNGAFENWNTYKWYDPAYYNTPNSQYASAGTATVQRTTDSYHGSYAIKLTTGGAAGVDTLQSYITNSFNDPTKGKGGVPISGTPTGISLRYKCNIVTGDTAIIFVIFKKSGAVLGNPYEYKLTGTATAYTLFSKTFSPALSAAPDSVIFGATPSNILNGHSYGVPNSMLQLDSINFTGIGSQPAMLNGDFESWVADSIFTLPGWYINNAQPTTDVYAGKYALELITQGPNSNNNSVETGFATTGINTGYSQPIGGEPFTHQVDTLDFYYKYAPATANDTAEVYMNFKNSGAPITGTGTSMSLLASTNYQHVEVPFSLNSAPDSVIVSIASSHTNNGNPPLTSVGDDLKIDNMHFKSQYLTGVANIKALTTAIKVYPNPANALINVDTKQLQGTVKKITICDMTGRILEAKSYTNGLPNTLVSFDINKFANGTFIIAINTDNGTYYQKFNKTK